MPRIRTVKPEFWASHHLSQIDFFARLLFIALFNFADDEGRGRAICKEINGFAFPHDENVTNSQIEKGLQQLSSVGCIRIYEHEASRFYDIPSWSDHQVINRPTASKFPSFDNSVITHVQRSDNAMLRARAPEVEVEVEVEQGKGTGKVAQRRTLERFEVFWNGWPKKVAKADAIKAWVKLNPNDDLCKAINEGVELWSGNHCWQKDNGQFIPNPASFLNGRRWEDEPTMATLHINGSADPPPKREIVDTRTPEERAQDEKDIADFNDIIPPRRRINEYEGYTRYSQVPKSA